MPAVKIIQKFHKNTLQSFPHLNECLRKCCSTADPMLNLSVHIVPKCSNTPVRPKKKNCLFPSERPGEIFFPTMWPVNFFRNNKWIKKILNRKRKLKKRKKNEISWKRKMLGHSSSLTFFIYIYKSQIHMFQLM